MGALDLPGRVPGDRRPVYTVMPLPTQRHSRCWRACSRWPPPASGTSPPGTRRRHMGALVGTLTALVGELDEAVLLFPLRSFADVSRVQMTIPMPREERRRRAQLRRALPGKLPTSSRLAALRRGVTYGPFGPVAEVDRREGEGRGRGKTRRSRHSPGPGAVTLTIPEGGLACLENRNARAVPDGLDVILGRGRWRWWSTPTTWRMRTTTGGRWPGREEAL